MIIKFSKIILVLLESELSTKSACKIKLTPSYIYIYYNLTISLINLQKIPSH